MTEEWPGDCPIPEWLERTVRGALASGTGRRPRVAHQRQITLAKTSAYYAVLNQDASFSEALAALFNACTAQKEWTAHKVGKFVAKWPLPPEGTKDLMWSYTLWERGLTRSPHLVPGARSFPGMPSSGPLALERGYCVRPPRSMNRADLKQGARRLFERVVARKSWYKIAGDEGETTYPRDIRAQRTQVANFAQELGIALPQNKAGRPSRVLKKSL
jgi:hypothetical protein